MTWLDSGGRGLNVKVIAGRRGGEGIHVDAEVHLVLIVYVNRFALFCIIREHK